MATIEELENRVRELSSEVEGEKAVTRQFYQQALRNGAQIGALRTELLEIAGRVDNVVTEVIQNSALLRPHGVRLEALTGDVMALRNDVTELRRGQEEIRARLDRLQADVTARLEVMERNIAAILAAVVPGNPPA